MSSPLTAYIALTSVSGVINLLLFLYVFLKRKTYGSISTFFLLGVATKIIYCFAYAFSLATSSTLGEMRFWSVMQYVGMPFAPPVGTLFIMQYLGYRITWRRVAGLLAIPVLVLLSNATNEWHHLHYKVYQIHETLGAPYYRIEIGPIYVIMVWFLYLCMMVNMVLLFSRWRHAGPRFRHQLLSLVFANLIPLVTSFLYLTGVTPEGIDPVPMVVGISSILMMWAIDSSRMLAIMPVAMDAVFHSIGDGVLVLDKSGRLVEYNDSCRRMFGGLERSMVGQPMEKVWSAMFGSGAPAPNLGENAQELEVTAEDGGGRDGGRTYQVRISPLKKPKKNSSPGTVMIISDITELKRMQQQLERHAYYDELTGIYNRRAFLEYGEAAYEQAGRGSVPFTAILFDIDHFKRINDTYGHQAGDQVLVHVAGITRRCLKKDMLFARYGGEEFVLALPGHSVSRGRHFAEMLRWHIESEPLMVNGQTMSIRPVSGLPGLRGTRASRCSIFCTSPTRRCMKRSGTGATRCACTKTIRDEKAGPYFRPAVLS